MSDFKVYREGEEESFGEIELLYCPRVGEKIWVERKHANGATHYIFRVKDVMHVVETDDDYAFVQLTVSESSREEAEPEEDESDDDRCECTFRGTIKPEVREAVMKAALAELHRKDKLFGGAGSVQM